MWTPELIKARFIEACDTAQRLPRAGMSNKAGFWPAYVHSFEDMNGWGTQRLKEEREMRLRRTPPSAAAITRHDEVVQWTSQLIDDEHRRQLIWAWAWCRMLSKSFAARCKEEGWVKITAYRRIHAIAGRISRRLANDRVLLRLPDEKWVIQETQLGVCIGGTLDEDGAQFIPDKSPEFIRLEKPSDTLNSEKAVRQFAAWLKRTNGERREAQRRSEHKKRKLLGIEDAAA